MTKLLLCKHTEDVPESKDNALLLTASEKVQNSVNSGLENPHRLLTGQMGSLGSSRSKMS